MNQDVVVDLAMQAMQLALKLGGPFLIVGLVIGLAVSVFQAVTQIQEQTLAFIPKVVGLALVILERLQKSLMLHHRVVDLCLQEFRSTFHVCLLC